MAIASTDAKALFTKTLIDVYQERPKVTDFLGSFFPEVVTPTKLVSIEIERGSELVAVDVLRGTEGNRNSFTLSTEKVIEPPFYREYFDLTELDLYDRVLGSQGNANTPLFAALINSAADKTSRLKDKIERRLEIQRAQVLMTGIVTLSAGVNIDFKRKAASLVDLTSAGGYFSANSDVFSQFAAACAFIRTVGKSSDAVYNAVLGETALADLLANTKFLARQNLFNMALDQIVSPVRNSAGAAYHGTITAGAYKVQLWSYPQSYTDPVSGTTTPYIDPKKIAVFPANPRFKTAFAAVPKLIDFNGQGVLPPPQAFEVGEYTDFRKAVHEIDIKAAAIAVPVAIDQLYTMKAVA